MGIYVFNTRTLLELLVEDAAKEDSAHDFGRNVLPCCLDRKSVVAYDFRDLNDKTARYWRDVGTLDAYYEANMDLVSVTPVFNLYDRRWPLRTHRLQAPPAKFVFASEGRRMGVALDSIVSQGCIISGGRITRSILSPGVRVNSYCEIDNSILMNRVRDRAQQPYSADHHSRGRRDSGRQRHRLRYRRRPGEGLHGYGFGHRRCAAPADSVDRLIYLFGSAAW